MEHAMIKMTSLMGPEANKIWVKKKLGKLTCQWKEEAEKKRKKSICIGFDLILVA